MPAGDAIALLTLMLCPGVGPFAIYRALATAKHFGCTLEALLDMAPRAVLEGAPGQPERVAQMIAACTPDNRDKARRLLERVEHAGGVVLSITNPDYPPLLARHLGHTSPPLLFCAGNVALMNEDAVGIVGARVATPDGLKLARRCAEVFSGEGIPIVSGGAAGVDTSAHEGALSTRGRAVIVLPQGLLTYRIPLVVAHAIEEGRACVVSEFVPDMAWQTQAAVTRNATISALSHMLCVIEPRKTGGSIRTAHCALQQGKRVLVYIPDDDALSQSLTRTFPHTILDNGNRFLSERILGFWRTATEEGRRQKELF